MRNMPGFFRTVARMGVLLTTIPLSLSGCAQEPPKTVSQDATRQVSVICSSSIPTDATPCQQKAESVCQGAVKLHSVKPPTKVIVAEGISQHPLTVAYTYDTVYLCENLPSSTL
ncbi:hypothetical protein SAMN04490207_1143 [Pseudomonas gessardii]|nr:hypothetical protein SAMN04490207_1143 [Pseudomonas gessardii]